jgi:hypothetical protein
MFRIVISQYLILIYISECALRRVVQGVCVITYLYTVDSRLELVYSAVH